MPEPSRARLFFDEIRNEGADAFQFVVSLLGKDDAAENGWRDYKGVGHLGKTGNPDKEDHGIKSCWSENLSAFANTSGGVLIWGIETKGKIPERLSLAPECESLADRLRTLTNDATDPFVAGVEVDAIKEPGSNKAGI